MQNKFSQELPNKEGFYWFYSKDYMGETPCILRVGKDKHGFFAEDEEFCFIIEKNENEFWCYIEKPEIPS